MTRIPHRLECQLDPLKIKIHPRLIKGLNQITELIKVANGGVDQSDAAFDSSLELFE